MIALERRKRIFELALSKGAVGVAELAQLLGAADNTIRADLAALEKEGKLLRSRGGAVLKEVNQPALPYQQVRDTNMLQKSQIAQLAASYFPSSGSVFINAGSTAHQLSLHIQDTHNFEVFTNSPEIACYLAQSRRLPVNLIGGRMVSESLETDGDFSRQLLDNIYWDAAFIGITALDLEHGITSINYSCAKMESQVLERSRLAIGLCDSSKLGRYSRAKAGDIEILNILITDSGADKRILESVAKRGVEVVVARES